jgi:hypothetical protein
VTAAQIVFGGLIIAGLLAAAGVFGYMQLAALRRLRARGALPDDERNFERRRAYLRLCSCALMILIALMLGVQLAFTEGPAQAMADERAAMGEQRPEFTSTERQFLRLWGGIWVAVLLALLGVVVLTAIDMFTHRARALRMMRRLQADRRSMIMRETERIRQGRDDTPLP